METKKARLQADYLAAASRAFAALEAVRERIEDLPASSSDRLDWGDYGEMARIADHLEELVEMTRAAAELNS